MYQQTDRFLKKLKEQIRREFNHLLILGFDELNVRSVKKETEEMYVRLLQFNEMEYRKVVSAAILYALGMLSAEQKKKAKTHNVDFYIDYVLTGYNLVTGYLYYPETERKRLRLGEEMMTAKEYFDRDRYDKVIRKGANLWYTQSGQYSQDIEDYVVVDLWRSAGVKKVQWIAELDDRTCEDCRDLHEQVFDIDHIPPKQHYHCRCILIPYE